MKTLNLIHKKRRASADVTAAVQSGASAASALEFLWAESRFRFRVFSYPTRGRSSLWLCSFIRNLFRLTSDCNIVILIKEVQLKPWPWRPARRERRPRNSTSSTRPSCPKCWERKTTSTAPTARRKVRHSRYRKLLLFTTQSYRFHSESTAKAN